MVRWWIAIAIAAAAAGCGPKHTNQCPSTTARTCVSGEVCTLDRSGSCHVCQCRPLGQTRLGHDPDDPDPAIPVH